MTDELLGLKFQSGTLSKLIPMICNSVPLTKSTAEVFRRKEPHDLHEQRNMWTATNHFHYRTSYYHRYNHYLVGSYSTVSITVQTSSRSVLSAARIRSKVTADVIVVLFYFSRRV
eukprot:6208597-Pleurochrysis_carterae.AAC.1